MNMNMYTLKSADIKFAIALNAISWLLISGYITHSDDTPATFILVLPIPQPIAYAYGCNGRMYGDMFTIRLMNTVPSTIPKRYTIINPFISSESTPYLFAITASCGSLHMELAIPIDFFLKPKSNAIGSAINTHMMSPSSSSMISGPV